MTTMPKPSAITVSRDMANRMWDLKFPIDPMPIFFWVQPGDAEAKRHDYWTVRTMEGMGHDGIFLPAWTAEEILRRLPSDMGDYNYLQCMPTEGGWMVGYWDCPSDPNPYEFTADTLADAAAAAWCYLKEHNLPPPK